MTQTGMDPNAPTPEQPKSASVGATTRATGASSSRRRHHRSESKHPSGRVEATTATATAPATSSDVAPAAGTSARARTTSPAPVAPVAEPATPEPAPAANPDRSTARRGNARRPSRPRGPKLVPQSRPESEATAPVEMAAPSVEAAVPAPEPMPEPAMPATNMAAANEPNAAHNAAPDSATLSTAATPARRYRFDRPARHQAPERPVRPERLSALSTAPEATIPIPSTPSIPSTAPEPAAGPRQVPVIAADAAPEMATLATLADELALTSPAKRSNSHHGADDTPAADAAVSAQPRSESATLDTGEQFEAEGADGAAPETDDAAANHKRRRRRRGNGSSSAVRHLEAIVPAEQMDAEPPTPIATRAGSRASQTSTGTARPEDHEERPVGTTYSGYGAARQPYDLYTPQQPEPWDITNAYQQIGQSQSPFGSPEPNIPRGFGPQPQGVASPAHERTARTARTDRGTDSPPMSANQLGAVLTSAIQQQTDRLLTELRHTQAPPSMTVQFPPLPSTERIGVFVDVANLLYAARSLRLSIDFGHLLEFLRSNRRLVRAHAYAPTSPEPNAEQQFLAVVKGVGYRITTKHYKTFSSGAKKADLDLDMCMDIVRLVDAKAVDTIALVSGDSDFLPLLEYCSDHGVRVEVAAFDDSAAMILRQSCDLFINLSLVPDIRA